MRSQAVPMRPCLVHAAQRLGQLETSPFPEHRPGHPCGGSVCCGRLVGPLRGHLAVKVLSSVSVANVSKLLECCRSNGLWRSLVSALDWGSRGREFKSPQPDGKGAGQKGYCKRN